VGLHLAACHAQVVLQLAPRCIEGGADREIGILMPVRRRRPTPHHDGAARHRKLDADME
jgi:hypothetical protein